MDNEEEDSVNLTEEQLLRQSFNRFDDNLVENILSYLTFTEKVMFESVSKQWKRSIYNQQKDLQLDRSDIEDQTNESLNQLLEPIEVIDFITASAKDNGLKQINKIWLKSVIKKCKSIEEVVLDCFLDFEDLDIICRNCPKLKSIELETIGLDANDLEQLGERYGYLFESVKFNFQNFESKYWNNFLIHCKNLKVFPNIVFSDELLENKEYLPKLSTVNYYHIEENETNVYSLKKFEKFCQKFGPTLTELCVDAMLALKSENVESFFNSIYKLEHLEVLDCFLNEFQENVHGIHNYINGLSKSMPYLKKLNLALDPKNCLNVDQIFKGFQGFNNLVDLDLNICGENKDIDFDGSVECLKSMKNLKHLSIAIETIGEKFFKDIDKHLPNLSKLIIGCETEITDKTITQLSHLKKLKEFTLNSFRKNFKNITDESVCAVINGCPLLEHICFDSRPNITNKTIEALINCANSYPKRSIRFECGLADEEEGEEGTGEQIPAINLTEFVDKIPENLTIDYTQNED